MSSILIRYPNAKIAQLVERQTENLCVGGSIPSLGTRRIMEDCPAGDAGPVLNAGGAERPGFRLRQSSAN